VAEDAHPIAGVEAATTMDLVVVGVGESETDATTAPQADEAVLQVGVDRGHLPEVAERVSERWVDRGREIAATLAPATGAEAETEIIEGEVEEVVEEERRGDPSAREESTAVRGATAVTVEDTAAEAPALVVAAAATGAAVAVAAVIVREGADGGRPPLPPTAAALPVTEGLCRVRALTPAAVLRPGRAAESSRCRLLCNQCFATNNPQLFCLLVTNDDT
jgi:hypothetical protein